MRIVLEMKLPVIVRLGGFHLLKSYLGCIGYIMKDSGFEDILQLIYPGNVDCIADGGSFYKSLRALFLIDAAFCSHLLKDDFDEIDDGAIRLFLKKLSDQEAGAQVTSDKTKKITKILASKIKQFSENDRTGKLWCCFHDMVCIVKQFITAERLHDWDSHLAAVVNMLWGFAAAGRGHGKRESTQQRHV